MSTVGSGVDDVVARLRAAGCVFAEDEAELLVAAAPSLVELDALVRRRVAGEPLEHLLGWAEFCGLRIAVGPGVFVPRRRTAVVVEQSVALLAGAAAPVVVDMCCGSGAVGAAIATRIPAARLHAADADPVAVAFARRNVTPVGGHVHVGDLYDALPPDLAGQVALVVANAPYVPTGAIAMMPPEARDHEPAIALDGGTDGLDVQRRVIAGAPAWLTGGGWLVVETSQEQADGTVAAFAAAGFAPRVVRSDDVDGTAVVGRLGAGGGG